MMEKMMVQVRNPSYYNIGWLDPIRPEDRLLSESQYAIAKRIVDLALAILTSPIWLPLVGLCALLIKLESPRGPVFFVQDRTGKGGCRFSMFKFRTMVVNAEEMKAELAHLNRLQWPDFKLDGDPRITRVGHLLRKTSLDELPQMFNILRGDMSFVGPRPTSFEANTYALWQTERLDVKPGLTGLWQIVARAEVEFYERARLDIIYIERRCLWLDLEILARTAPAVLQGKGAR